VPTTLRAPALREDWRAWASAWAALDAGPVADLLRRRKRPPVQLTLCGERNAQGLSQRAARPGTTHSSFFRPQRFMDVREQL
jgi:hypothetical protein